MMTTRMIQTAAHNDFELVAASLNGNRDAFGEIVARYQSLICSLAYSATGCLGQSEDLAQETFITAWKQLGDLREPSKLRAWLCGIARNRINSCLRREGREPVHAAEPLETVPESPSAQPSPSDQAISKEEAAILWRSIEHIPDLYREPLVLFYREEESVERVAAALELSEDAVRQRLSRGRKLLHEQVLALVEGTLRQTAPGRTFTLGVIAALPLLATTAKAVTVGTALANHGSVAAKTTTLGGFLQASSKILLGFVYWMAPILPLGAYIGYKMGGDRQHSERARRSVATFWRIMGASMLLFVFLPPLLFALLLALFHKTLNESPARIYPFARFWMDLLSAVLICGVAPLSLVIWVWQRRRRIGPETVGGAPISSQAGKSTTIWAVLAMTGALVYLAGVFWMSSINSRFHLPKLQSLSTAEVQNLIANPKGRDIEFCLSQWRNGFRYLTGEVRENGAQSPFDAPAENSTLALLAEKGISYKTVVYDRDFTRGRAVWWLGDRARLWLLPAFCFFIVVAGAVTLLRRRDHQQSEPRPIAAARNERRVDKVFAALAACGIVAVAVLLGLTTDWKVRRVAPDQVPGIIAQHKNARFEIFEYGDGSRKLWISDLRSPDFIAHADESTLGLLTRQGITYQTYLSFKIGRPMLSQSTSALGILLLGAAAGSVLWWVMKRKPLAMSRV